jgi:glycosyltransferase involved in cell wall biosynthesis
MPPMASDTRPPILLDISRLVSRASRLTPTGIDRIELAYAEHLIANAGDRLGFVAMNAAGDISPVRPRYGTVLMHTLAKSWRDPEEGGRTARRIGLLAQASGLLPGRAWLSPSMRQHAGRPVYLLVSHQNLHRRTMLTQFKARSGAAFVFFVHDLIPIDYPEYGRPGQADRHAQRVATICALADGIICNSHDTAASIQPHIAASGRAIPVLVAHPGAEFHAHAHTPHDPAEPPYFVCIGTIEPRKNHLLLLHVWRHLARSTDPIKPRLILIGQRGWENENILDLIERCTAIKCFIEERTSLPDRDMRTLLARASALLCPAFAEGYGLPIAEALALHVPVICSDIPVFHEVGGDAPDYLDPLDGLGWLEAIRDYAQPGSLRRAAQIARLENWTAPRWEPHMQAVLALLDQVSKVEEKEAVLF